jgi:hypothetical protein
MLFKLLHDGVGHGHVFKHALQFRCELTTAFSLKPNDNRYILGLIKIVIKTSHMMRFYFFAVTF